MANTVKDTIKSRQVAFLVADGVDVAIRICGPLADSSLVARLLSVSPMVMVASPAYVYRHGLPRIFAAQ